ncbi:MAG: hypothetical protein QW275_02470 [Candidatus Anstonellaceae archaeon]
MNIKMVYTPTFKQFVRENNGIIKKFLEVYKNGIERYDDGVVKIQRFDSGMFRCPDGSMVKNGQVHYRLWKVEVGGKKLFVKETLREERWEKLHFTGILQYKQMQRLSKFARAISKIWKNNIEVLAPHFAAIYWDTSFLVTDFIELPRAANVEIPNHLAKQLKTFRRLADLIVGIFDIYETNAFYDNVNGKLIVYDPGKNIHSFPIRAIIYAGRALKKIYNLLLHHNEEPTKCAHPVANNK